MKFLFALLVVSVVAILATVIAMWWRLRRHLRRPGSTAEGSLEAVRQEPDSTE